MNLNFSEESPAHGEAKMEDGHMAQTVPRPSYPTEETVMRPSHPATGPLFQASDMGNWQYLPLMSSVEDVVFVQKGQMNGIEHSELISHPAGNLRQAVPAQVLSRPHFMKRITILVSISWLS